MQSKSHARSFVTAGVDSATRNLGVCVLCGTSFELFPIRVPSGMRGPRRLNYICERVMAPLVAAQVRLVAIEDYSFGSAGKWFALGEVGGTIKHEVWKAGMMIVAVTPAELKKFVTNNGAASKPAMIRGVLQHYNVDVGSNDNLADAAGLAKFAQVLKTGESKRRCELETVKRFLDRTKDSNQDDLEERTR